MSLQIPTKKSNKKRKDQELLKAFNAKFNLEVEDVTLVKKALNNPEVRPWYLEYKESIAEQNRVNNGWRPPRSAASSQSRSLHSQHQQHQQQPHHHPATAPISSSSNITNPLLESLNSSTLIPSTTIQEHEDSNDPLVQKLLKEFNESKSNLIKKFEIDMKNLEDEYNKKIDNIEIQTFIKNMKLEEDK